MFCHFVQVGFVRVNVTEDDYYCLNDAHALVAYEKRLSPLNFFHEEVVKRISKHLKNKYNNPLFRVVNDNGKPLYLANKVIFCYYIAYINPLFLENFFNDYVIDEIYLPVTINNGYVVKNLTTGEYMVTVGEYYEDIYNGLKMKYHVEIKFICHLNNEMLNSIFNLDENIRLFEWIKNKRVIKNYLADILL